jgi:hypothetical protein
MKKKGATELLPSAVKTYDALDSIWSALEANPKQLAARLRRGDASKAEMALAADLIEGKKKPRRPRSSREQRLIIAEHVAWVRKLHPTWQRKKIISVAVEWLKRSHQHISERHVYNALAEFDDNAVAQINQMPKSEAERAIEPDQRLRDDLKDVDRDLLIEIIEGFLARE